MNDAPDRPWFRRKRFWAVLLLLAIVALLVGRVYLEIRRTDALLTELQKAGLPTTAEELDGFYAVPEGHIDTTKPWVSALAAVEQANIKSGAPELPIVGNSDNAVPPPGQPWDQLAEAAEWLASREREIRLIHQAASAGGRVRFPIDLTAGINTLLPQVQQTREAARMLSLHAYVSAHEGDFQAARQDIIAMLRMSDITSDEPVFISQLVRVAIRTMACDVLKDLLWHSDWNDQQLAELQSEIAATDLRRSMLIALQGERALFLSALDQVTMGPFRHSNVRSGVKLFADVLDGLDEGWPAGLAAASEATARVQKLASESRIKQLSSIGVVMMMPATEQGLAAGARGTALQRCAMIAVAQRRHWLQTQTIVDKLAQLPAELFSSAESEAVLTDPFTANPLLFQRSPDRFTVYSAGQNQEDDGGAVESERGRPEDAGLAIVTAPPAGDDDSSVTENPESPPSPEP